MLESFMSHLRLHISAISAALVVAGCSSAPASMTHDDDGGAAETSDLPCEIDALLATYCRSCHQQPLIHVPMALSTHADLTRMSHADPTATYAERAALRMRASTSPMPPRGTRPSEAEIAAFEAWLNAGAPEGQCEP